MARHVPALTTVALLVPLLSPLRGEPRQAALGALVGSWRLEDATPDPELFRAIPGPAMVDTGRDWMMAFSIKVDAQEADETQTYLNDVAPHLFSRDNYLAIATPPLHVSVSGSLETVDYPINDQSLKASIAGVAVKVSTESKATSLVQEITGDHSLKIERTFQASDDGSELHISLSVVSPKVKPPLLVTRTYRKLAATPYTGLVPSLPSASLQVTASPTGGSLVTEEANLTLHPAGKRTDVLFVRRPISPVTVVFESLGPAAGDTVDLSQPGPVVSEVLPGGTQQTVGTTIEVTVPATPAPVDQVLQGPGRSIVLTWMTANGPRSCLLPINFEAATVDEAGALVFNAVPATLPNGSTNCESVEHGLKARVTYAIAAATPGKTGKN